MRCTAPDSSATSSCGATAAPWSSAVRERPSIESFTITGNKDIKTEDLEKSLRDVGLARGKTFNQSTLDEVERFLTDQYYSRGKYAVRVDTKIEELPDNRVKIAIDVAEGKRARIRQINVVGNEAFDDEELLDEFKLAHAELAVVVPAGRPLLARGAFGRHREAAVVLHGPRLRELRRRDDAGRNRAGEGRHLRHAQRQGRRGVSCLGREDRRQPRGAGVGPATPGAGAARRHLLAQDDHADDRADGAAARRGRLRVRQDRPGAAGERGDQGDRAHVRRRARQPRLRPAHQVQRHDRDQRRRAAARDAADGGRISVERRRRAVEAATAAAAVHREGRGRDDAGARARPTWSTWNSTSRKVCPASSAAASAIPNRSRSS